VSDHILDEQRAYYRARAPEYDEWWQRRGRYDRGEAETAAWRRQVAVLEDAVSAFAAAGDVLELAGGTGWWTRRLAVTAGTLTVVDSSPETLAINRERVQRPDVHYVVADLFRWTPRRRYDVVFFSFWLSHVPRDRFGGFWSFVGSCLRPGGRVFLIDNRDDPESSEPHRKDPYVVEYGADQHLRRLGDGSEFRVVKVMYEPAELAERLAAEGWRAELDGTRWFIFGSAAPVS
jgi:SAM-dependent methyltransferase